LIYQKQKDMNTFQELLNETVAYFYNEHYGAYFGVTQYRANENGDYLGGIPSGVYCKETMDKAGIPYIGVKKETKGILYL
jgi:hypothetical protein